MMNKLQSYCPMAGQDVQTEVSDVDNGVALTFTTKTGDVDELRQRVRRMAEMYAARSSRREMHWQAMGRGGMGPGGGGPGRMMGAENKGAMGRRGPMPAADTKVEEVEGGARIVLTPKDSSQLKALREHAHWHQQRMQSGECPVFQQSPALKDGNKEAK
jgi:hypothetical protein